jgi:hypothetical protein
MTQWRDGNFLEDQLLQPAVLMNSYAFHP